ncbi:MAG: tRNA lysidine(34) synthetase TilS, partial [Planctomycetota bacterium]
MAAAVTRALQDALQPGDRVILACSGGVDSMVLLEILARHRGPELANLDVIVAHFNHGVHDKADAMQQLVRHHADAVGLQAWCEAGSVDVPPGESFEHCARKARYAFLATVAAKHGARAVLTAHTQTDQDETILMMLLEGTGLAGLRGIPMVRDLDEAPGVQLIRPMLDTPREQVLAFAREHHVPWEEDPTNTDTRMLRNRVRHVVLPFLEEHGNAQVRRHLRALSAEARAWVADSDERVDALLERVWQRDSSPPTLDMRTLHSESRALVSAVLLHAVKDLGVSPRSISRGTIESLLGV